MGVTWFNGEPKEIIVTLTHNSITINKSGSQLFEFANQVMLGYDVDKRLILIKLLSKDEVLRGDIPEHSRYNVSVNTSYGRITNKAFLTRIDSLFNLSLDEKGSKYRADWNKSLNVLEVYLEEVL
ncbi:hypothetical protein [Acholeplasma granularum]|uniref:hypothetical protein n=1 Tax=Acholeplasma granularum TaxID=264635 RepID=UPI000470BE7E|nr:hypothetical protein [Acholeplasma granularum]